MNVRPGSLWYVIMLVGVLYGHTEAIYVVLCQYKDQCGHVIMSVGVLYGHTEAIYVILC